MPAALVDMDGDDGLEAGGVLTDPPELLPELLQPVRTAHATAPINARRAMNFFIRPHSRRGCVRAQRAFALPA